MEHNVVVRMAKVLYGMVLAVFVFNLLVLPLVPGYTMMAYEGMGMGHPSISSLMGTMRSLLGAGVPAWEILVVRPLAMLGGDWSGYGPEVWWSAAFFLGCGICTAVLLWPGPVHPVYDHRPDSLSAVQCPVHEAGGGQLLGASPCWRQCGWRCGSCG